MPTILGQLCAHHRWANLMLLDACAALPDGVLEADLPGTFGSVRETLRHIVLNEGNYLAGIPEAPPLAPWPEHGAVVPIAELRERAARSGDALIAVAGGGGEDRVIEVEWRGQPHAIPLSIFVTQAINHATEHRAQIATILTQQGVRPPTLDAWAFDDAAGSAS